MRIGEGIQAGTSRARSSSTVVFGAMPKVSTSTFRTFGETKPGSFGPGVIPLTPRPRRTSRAYQVDHAVRNENGGPRPLARVPLRRPVKGSTVFRVLVVGVPPEPIPSHLHGVPAPDLAEM